MNDYIAHLINVVYPSLKFVRQEVLYFNCRKINIGLESVSGTTESLKIFSRAEPRTQIWVQGCIFSYVVYYDPMNRQRLFSIYLLQKM